ncbi:MAG: hypothetical protein AAGJ28_11055, partial [Pseudomonadota bacterium]
MEHDISLICFPHAALVVTDAQACPSAPWSVRRGTGGLCMRLKLYSNYINSAGERVRIAMALKGI